MPLPGIAGFIGGTALQSAIFGILAALFRKKGRSALGAATKAGFNKILGRAGAPITPRNIANLKRFGAEGATVGVGFAGFDLAIEGLVGAAGGGQSDSRPTLSGGSFDNVEEADLQEILQLLLEQSQGQAQAQAQGDPFGLSGQLPVGF